MHYQYDVFKLKCNFRAGSDISKTSSTRGRGLIKLRGFSVKSDSDSGIDGDSMVGEIKIKQVGGIIRPV